MSVPKFHVMDNVVWISNEYIQEMARDEAAREQFEKTWLKIFRERAERAVDAAWERNS